MPYTGMKLTNCFFATSMRQCITRPSSYIYISRWHADICLSIIRICNLEILTQYSLMSQCLSMDIISPSNSFLLHAVCSCMASIVILYCIIIRRAAKIWKLHPMLKFPTKIPLSWRNDLGSVSSFCDLSADSKASYDLSDISEFISMKDNEVSDSWIRYLPCYVCCYGSFYCSLFRLLSILVVLIHMLNSLSFLFCFKNNKFHFWHYR